MGGIVSAAGVLGGLGLFLIGTRLTRGGMARSLTKRLAGELGSRAPSPRRSLVAGLVMAAAAPGEGRVPAEALGVGRYASLRPDEATPLVLGASLGCAITACGVLATTVGWGVYALALIAVAIGAAMHLMGSRWDAWGETVSGWGAVLIGVQMVGTGFQTLGQKLQLPGFGGELLPLLAVYGGAGIALTLLLRSPGATTVLAIQSVGGRVIDAFAGAACGIGVLLAVPWTTCRKARTGGSDQRAVAALQATSFLLSAMVGLAILILTASLAGARANEPGIAVPLVAGFMVLSVVCGTAATWPLMAPLARLYQERLPDGAPPEGLDLAGALPALAVCEIGDRTQDAAAIARGLARDVLRGERITEFRLEEDLATFSRLRDAVEEPLSRIDDEPRAGSVVAALSRASETLQRHGLLFDTAAYLRDRNPEGALEPQLAQQVKRLALEVSRLVDACDPRSADTSGVRTRWTSLEDRLIALRSDLTRACSIGTLPAHLFEATLERLDELRQIGQLVIEGTEALSSAGPVEAAPFPESSREAALMPAGAISAPTG